MLLRGIPESSLITKNNDKFMTCYNDNGSVFGIGSTWYPLWNGVWQILTRSGTYLWMYGDTFPGYMHYVMITDIYNPEYRSGAALSDISRSSLSVNLLIKITFHITGFLISRPLHNHWIKSLPKGNTYIFHKEEPNAAFPPIASNEHKQYYKQTIK